MTAMLSKGAIVKGGGQGYAESVYVLAKPGDVNGWHRVGKSASEGYISFSQIPHPEILFRGVEA